MLFFPSPKQIFFFFFTKTVITGIADFIQNTINFILMDAFATFF